MTRTTMATLAGVGLFVLAAAGPVEAQSCRTARPGYRPARLGASYEYRTHGGFNGSYAPRIYAARHCGRCVPFQQRVWVPTTTYRYVVTGYDAYGWPVYAAVPVQTGCYRTCTRYRCR